MRILLPLLASFALVGCAPKDESVASDPSQAQTQDGGVAPMASGAAGGMTPVSGAESVGGAGMGGVGSAAKDQAKRAAAGGGSSSMGATEGGGD